VTTWSETSTDIRPRSSLTERARRQACRLVGEDQQDVASVAVMLGVGWGTVMRAVVEYGTPLVQDPARLAGVASIGVDQTSFLAANRFHHSELITGVVALPGPGRPSAQLLDVIPGPTAVVQPWISARPPKWRERRLMTSGGGCSSRAWAGGDIATIRSTGAVAAPRVVHDLEPAAVDQAGEHPGPRGPDRTAHRRLDH